MNKMSPEAEYRNSVRFLENTGTANLMLLSGRPPYPVDALFFHNRSYGDYTGLNEKAQDLLIKGGIRFIVITNNEGERFGSKIKFEANPGKTAHIKDLTENYRVPRNNILVPNPMGYNAREENDAFLGLSIQHGWRSAVILTQPHQLLRAILGMVQAMDIKGYQMEIYTVAPDLALWHEIAYGNQGMEQKPRYQNIPDELERIYLRQSTGELATFEHLFDYLKAREEGRLILGPTGRGKGLLLRHLPQEFQAGPIA